jgi:DNA sulfur modification protein DndD
MIIQSLEIENYGVFRGKHNFNLVPNLKENKPIILFGGLNGAGKTTLFEGIKLCLYGQPILQEFNTKKEYNSYLMKRIKSLNPESEKIQFSAIELKIEFNSFGVKDNYSIRRNWKIEGENLEENFRVLKNGQMLGRIEQEYSQTFIANLIPMGVSSLFFFDGEKIQELATDNVENGYFKEALDSILGLDVIQTLVKDLKIYAYRQNGSENNNEVIKEIEIINKKIQLTEEEIGDKTQEHANIKTRLERTSETINKKENELSLQGAGYAKNRYEFKDKINKIETEIEEIRNKLKEYYSDTFPFTLVPDLCSQLKDILQQENTKKNELAALTVIETKKHDFKSRLLKTSDQSENMDKTKFDNLVDDIFTTLQELIKESQNGEFKFINDFSEKEINQLLFWVDQTINIVPKEIKTLSNKYNKLLADRNYYEDLLRKSPEDSILDPIVSEINTLYENKGSLNNQLIKIDENLNSLRFHLAESKRQNDKLQEKFELMNKNNRKINDLRNIRLMLDEYQNKIRIEKMEMLRNAFLDANTMIMRKTNFIRNISIDSNYDIKLQREKGNFISKSILSNGEKQIYAVSMLLALARISGKPLPFIIDTPMARLDSEHRDKIVENFFPYASHQVIIFSTDTEIDKVYFDKITPYITRAYHLQFDDNKGTSAGVEGYFWKILEVTQD